MTDNKITIEDFIKLDLRIGTIVEAEEVEDSRKMLKLRINLGEDTRTVFAGIKKSYSSDDLLDKQVIVIANLMPREMKFGVSDGMVLATSDKEEIVLISPLKNVSPGSKISRSVVVSLYPRPAFKISIPSTCLLTEFQFAIRIAPNPGVSEESTTLTIGRELYSDPPVTTDALVILPSSTFKIPEAPDPLITSMEGFDL